MATARPSTSALLVGAACAPFAVMSLYLFFSRWPSRWFTEGTDYASGGLAVAAGVWYVVRLRVPVVVRIPLCVGYTVAVGLLLIGYSLGFVCGVFGDCP